MPQDSVLQKTAMMTFGMELKIDTLQPEPVYSKPKEITFLPQGNSLNGLRENKIFKMCIHVTFTNFCV